MGRCRVPDDHLYGGAAGRAGEHEGSGRAGWRKCLAEVLEGRVSNDSARGDDLRVLDAQLRVSGV
ncbi:hypothetical protein SDC9_137699 [bioreactor metagenome]|uniref:Uncharacterized protein n=1 Tax=bioreactor metagenome TaxID=1076179 RepID=A0A645DN96_9ZZZZ